MVRRIAGVALLASLGLGSTARAQIGISLRASTLGAGGELSIRPSKYLGIRVGGNYLSFTRSLTIEGIDYDITPKFQSGNAILDLHPFGSAFHVSGGLFRNSNRGDVVARLTGPVTIGNQTYQPSDVGALTGNLTYANKYVPYAGIGFGGRSRISLVFDVGVVFAGYPQASLTGSSSLTGQAKAVFDQNVQSEVQQIQTDINGRSYLKYHPVVSFGLRLGI